MVLRVMLAPLLTLCMLCGCAQLHGRAATGVSVAVDLPQPNDWRLIASALDSARIGRIGVTWEAALADVRVHGSAKALAGEGALLDPAAALARPAPPPGVYHCRVIRLGRQGTKRGTVLTAFKPFFCFVAVEGPLLTFTKGSGTHRPGGRLWDDGETRLVFLGGVSQRPDGPLPAYGANAATNQVGVVERIGDFRWRMVLPDPTPEAKLDVMELLPDAPLPGAK